MTIRWDYVFFFFVITAIVNIIPTKEMSGVESSINDLSWILFIGIFFIIKSIEQKEGVSE